MWRKKKPRTEPAGAFFTTTIRARTRPLLWPVEHGYFGETVVLESFLELVEIELALALDGEDHVLGMDVGLDRLIVLYPR
jgi:hypothetical protein